MKVISLFTGAGGLDLGFGRQGFDIVWSNEFDSSIWPTLEVNFSNLRLDKRDITKIPTEQIPTADGIIGGPPCQSWSEAGAGRGIDDVRGKLFYDYVRILRAKQPKFFLAESVPGILHTKNKAAFDNIIRLFESVGYSVVSRLVNANDYGVPQDRLRVIIVGYHMKLQKKFNFPAALPYKPNLRDAIWGMPSAQSTKASCKINDAGLTTPNHAFLQGSFSPIYMSRNRVRSWHEPSFTIQAGGRHIPIHPQAPKMRKIGTDKREFIPEYEMKYRRLSVRECAKIQTFPDDFIFQYESIENGYKMVGNAVPVRLAECLASAIAQDLSPSHTIMSLHSVLRNRLLARHSV
ncbi:DNA cytosine methyltransferase [Candidatus Saccharibacteria bacterium]|nr:DNA cytosine methyltransferase [Candidatus Saccharibacteria bacterium]